MRNLANGILCKGEVINSTYEVQFFIGQGGFGEVYRVKHKYLGLQVLKVFKEEYSQKTDISTLVQEARILSNLTHNNIVRVFEANEFIKDGKVFYYITMAFVSGETLSQRLSRFLKLPFSEALTIQTDLLSGLSFLHSQSPAIIHRDINTDNLLLSYDDNIAGKLADFGLAQSVDPISTITDAAGRYVYFAPECFWNAYFPSSDVFSTGLVFYKMVTGVQPWYYNLDSIEPGNYEQISNVIISARKEQPKKPSYYNSDCNNYFDEITLRAISLNLENRYLNAVEYYSALTSQPIDKKSSSNNNPAKKTASNQIASFIKEKGKGKGFDAIAGMTELKETLYNDVIMPLKEKELYEKYKVSVPNGMLLYGPPGCGKTFIARQFSEEIDFNFIELKPSDLASIYVHGTQEKIGLIFKEAREKAPTVIFIDELDAILPNREGDLGHHYASEVNEFLAQMTECNKDGIFIIAATNRPEKIDPAILRTGRMDKVIYLAPPDFEARHAMFKLFLVDRPVDKDIDLKRLAELTVLYVSSDISFLVNEASRNALKERSDISQQHFEEAIKKFPPSISERQLKKYETFSNNRNFV
ncbi:MAG: AAA family ATPase [Prolixibacteraceae bacterium]